MKCIIELQIPYILDHDLSPGVFRLDLDRAHEIDYLEYPWIGVELIEIRNRINEILKLKK